jgi:hypothetical protein
LLLVHAGAARAFAQEQSLAGFTLKQLSDVALSGLNMPGARHAEFGDRRTRLVFAHSVLLGASVRF